MTLKQMSDDTYKQAREVMVRQEYFETQKWKDQQLRADRKGAHMDILDFERKFISKMKANGIPMFAPCVMRSRVEQQILYDRGFSKAKAGKSPHQHGMAVDIVHSTMAWDLPSRKCWELIGMMGKEVAASAGIKVEWGGDWKFYDPAHWQLANWEENVSNYP